MKTLYIPPSSPRVRLDPQQVLPRNTSFIAQSSERRALPIEEREGRVELCDSSRVEHDDPIAVRDCLQAMGDRDQGDVVEFALDDPLDQGVGLRIDRCGRFVQ